MNNLKILICDDMVMIRSLIKKSLNDLGFHNLFEAQDGKEAMTLIQEAFRRGENFDIVFIDWNMPHMNGLEVVQACKTDSNFQSLPFIMISAERDHKNIVQALKSGVTDYILKPFSATILSAKLSKIVNLKKVA